MSRRRSQNSWIAFVAIATFLALTAMDALSRRHATAAEAAAQPARHADCRSTQRGQPCRRAQP